MLRAWPKLFSILFVALFAVSVVGGKSGLVLCISHLGDVALEAPHSNSAHCHDSDAEIEHHAVMECLPDDHGCADLYLAVNVVAPETKRAGLPTQSLVAILNVSPSTSQRTHTLTRPAAHPILLSHQRISTVVLLI